MKKKISIRVFIARCSHWVLFAAFLNTIIDAPGEFCVSYNEMESLVEWVSEDLMDMDNAVPEREGDHQDKQQHQKKTMDWTTCHSGLSSVVLPLHPVRRAIMGVVFYFNPVFEVNTPPPEIIS